MYLQAGLDAIPQTVSQFYQDKQIVISTEPRKGVCYGYLWEQLLDTFRVTIKQQNIYIFLLMIPKNNEVHISPEGQARMQQLRKTAQYQDQYSQWTDDPTVELPIKFGSSQYSKISPTTAVQEWKETIKKYGKNPALSVKKNGIWVTISYEQYYEECIKFAKALLALGCKPFSTVNIIGFNSPQWMISFFGTILAKCIIVGIYLTNSQEICEYIAEHSQSRIIIAQNYNYAKKYFALLYKGIIDKIIIYGEEVNEENEKIISWNKFLSLGDQIENAPLEKRMSQIKPGHCCSIIYTSGTTGLPKGVMCSHDNFIWNSKVSAIIKKISRPIRMVSYLPLSHVAAQFMDIYRSLITGAHIFFAQPTALQGTLFQTLRQVRPQQFFAVPRIWEKVYYMLKDFAKSNKMITPQQDEWARKIGEQETIKEVKGLPVSQQFQLAKKLVFNKYKQILGLDKAFRFNFGSAPLNPAIRQYFTSINMFLYNGYGMTETTAPAITTLAEKFNAQSQEDYIEVGTASIGTQVKLQKNKPNDEEGQICIRGRHIFMGYLKNAAQTSKTVDSQGFLHSGDLAIIDKNGSFFITGRIKELIITAGGENIPPILIENQIKNTLPCLSNVMVVGDQRRYLTCLVSLKMQDQKIDLQASNFLKAKGCKCQNIAEARDCLDFKKIILGGINIANSKAISRAQCVQDFYLIPEDFNVESGILTPSLKLKRKEALKKYSTQIDKMYLKSKI